MLTSVMDINLNSKQRRIINWGIGLIVVLVLFPPITEGRDSHGFLLFALLGAYRVNAWALLAQIGTSRPRDKKKAVKQAVAISLKKAGKSKNLNK